MNIEKGVVVRSKAGHDKGRFYCILNVENGLILLVDGKIRKKVNPKRKNINHLECSAHQVVRDIDKMTDKKIRRLLREITEKSV